MHVKKGIFEKFFFLVKFEGEIVVQRKLKVKFKKTKDQAKTERKMNANRDAQKQKVMKKGCKKHLMKEKKSVFHERDSFF